jgi:hypothetical protein
MKTVKILGWMRDLSLLLLITTIAIPLIGYYDISHKNQVKVREFKDASVLNHFWENVGQPALDNPSGDSRLAQATRRYIEISKVAIPDSQVTVMVKMTWNEDYRHTSRAISDKYLNIRSSSGFIQNSLYDEATQFTQSGIRSVYHSVKPPRQANAGMVAKKLLAINLALLATSCLFQLLTWSCLVKLPALRKPFRKEIRYFEKRKLILETMLAKLDRTTFPDTYAEAKLALQKIEDLIRRLHKAPELSEQKHLELTQTTQAQKVEEEARIAIEAVYGVSSKLEAVKEVENLR